MPDGQVLEFTRVTKRFNDVTAVSDFSARIEPGVVTAFLGPNGAGKTTTLRILLGQVRPTTGSATIGGVAFADLRTPLRTIGSVLEETVYRPRRTASRQLTIAAKANGIPLSRVGEVLSLVGLDGEGEGRIGSFSLGMRQRLSVAHALLGDAGTLVFDEPANGLDPEGIRWMRLLMRRLADEGRTVIVSSHVLSEVEQVADHVLVLSKGKLVLSSGIESLADPAAGSVVVDAADRAALTAALATAGFEVEILRSGLTVRGGDAKTVGAVAASAGIALSTLVQRGPTLEDVFIELVRNGRFEPRPAIAAAPDAEAPVVVAPVAAAVATEADVTEAVVTAAAQTDADEIAADVDEVDAAEVEAGEVEAPVDPEPVIAPEPIAQAGPSFDDILFGAGSVTSDEDEVDSVFDSTSSESETQDEHAPSGVDIFARLGGIDTPDRAESGSDESESEATGSEEYGSEESDSEEPGSEEPRSDEPRSDDETPADHGESVDSGEQHTETDGDEDPRSAAVSSMLAAAARAYYDDEPKPYPGADAHGEEHAGEHGADGHHEQAEENSSGDEHEAVQHEHEAVQHDHEAGQHEHEHEHEAGQHEDAPAESIEHDGGESEHGDDQHDDSQHGDDEHSDSQHDGHEHHEHDGHEHRDGDHHYG